MGTKVKISKQKMKEDKFTTTMLQWRDWILDNWQVLALVGAVVVLAVVGIVYYTGIRQTKGIEGSQKLAQAVDKMYRQNYQLAIVELNEVVDNYSGHVAALAQFHLGNAYYESKNYDEAINSFEKYISKYHEDKLKTASAIAGVAAALEGKQEFQGAAEKYLEAEQYYPGAPGASAYLLGAVRNFVNVDQKEMAREALDRLRETFPGSEQLRTAITLTARLGLN